MKCLALLVLFAFVAFGCGKKPGQEPQATASTPYGSPQELAGYLQQIDPLVMQLNTAHQDLYKRVGTSGKATGANLAQAMAQGLPQLQQALKDVEQISPPALMAPFHDKLKKLVQLRVEAYSQTIEGRQLEEAKDPQFESHYTQSEQKLAEAQSLGSQLGQERQQIQQALLKALPQDQAASR